MAKMQTGRKNGNGKNGNGKNGNGDPKAKKHTIIDKNCVKKVIQNNKVISSYQIQSKEECDLMRKKIDTAIDKNTGHQTYKSQMTGPNTRKGTLSQSHVNHLRKQYKEAKDMGPKSAKAYLQSLPKSGQEALKQYGIK
jgi:hypothetical protein